MQKQSPLLRLWELGNDYHSGLLRAILSAFIGVLCGMIPYFAAAQILIGLIQGERDTGFYLTWCIAPWPGIFSGLFSTLLPCPCPIGLHFLS